MSLEVGKAVHTMHICTYNAHLYIQCTFVHTMHICAYNAHLYIQCTFVICTYRSNHLCNVDIHCAYVIYTPNTYYVKCRVAEYVHASLARNSHMPTQCVLYYVTYVT